MQYSALKDSRFGLSLQFKPGQLLAPRENSQLRAMLQEHGLMVIRGKAFSDDEHAGLVAAFGRVETDATGSPLLMQVTNTYEDSSAPQGELGFHFDYSYDPYPVPVIALYGSEIVDGVTPTLFAPSVVSLEDFPAELYKVLRGREAAHACFTEQFSHDFMQTHLAPDIARGATGWSSEHWWMRKPVFEPLSGKRMAIYLCELYTHCLIGLPEDESRAVLKELFEWLYQPERYYQHQWRADDMVIWDNLRVQHARPIPNDKQRTLRRFHTAEDKLTEDYLRVGRASEYL